MSIILCDLDGVIADWDHSYDAMLDSFGDPAARIPRSHERKVFNLFNGLSETERDIVQHITQSAGFYAGLRPIPGAKEALKEMLAYGHEVRIVTSPWISNPTCASDKLNWVVNYIGQSWGQRTIITTDKTLVHGDFLIDDKPEVKGSLSPSWEHIYFTQPVNSHLTANGRRRIDTWGSWKDVLHT